MGETVNFMLCASQHNFKNAGQLSQGPDRLSNHSTPRPRPARQIHTRREGARLSPDTPGFPTLSTQHLHNLPPQR